MMDRCVWCVSPAVSRGRLVFGFLRSCKCSSVYSITCLKKKKSKSRFMVELYISKSRFVVEFKIS